MGLFSGLKSKKNKKDLLHPVKYKIERPAIPTGELYFFTTDSGLRYEVRFGRIKNSLSRVINFNVIDDEFEDDEYAETNRGEIYRIVSTVIDIFIIYKDLHSKISSYVFSGEFKDEENDEGASIRTRFFIRSVSRALPGIKVEIINNSGHIEV